MCVCIQFVYIYVDWVIYSQGAFSFFFKEIEYLIIFAVKRTNNSKKAVETIKSPFLEITSYKIPCLLIFYEIFDACGWRGKNSSCRLCARPAALFTFPYLIHLAAPRDRCYLPSTYGKTGLDGQHNLPKVTPMVSGGR